MKDFIDGKEKNLGGLLTTDACYTKCGLYTAQNSIYSFHD